MKDRINIAELLRDCPMGMELDCTMFDNVTFEGLNTADYPINIKVMGDDCYKYLTKTGCWNNNDNAKCVIFPKGKTTWEGFKRPFKDGDILISGLEDCCNPFIFKQTNGFGNAQCYCAINVFEELILNSDNWTPIKGCRLATEEEKQKLFDAIKANGYKWNAETKTLEKLEDIEDKGNISDGYHTFNELYEYRLLYNASMFNELAKQGLYDVHKSKLHSDGTIPFGDDNWFIVQAELPTGQISNHYEMKDWDLFQVPIKEKANQYDGHTPQDVAKRLRDFLTLEKLVEPKFKARDKITDKNKFIYRITEVTDKGYKLQDLKTTFITFEEADLYFVKVMDVFDVTTLVPFESRVLVRSTNEDIWIPAIYGFSVPNKYYIVGGIYWRQCIPYNEETKHLLGTTNDCDEYYKTWE